MAIRLFHRGIPRVSLYEVKMVVLSGLGDCYDRTGLAGHIFTAFYSIDLGLAFDDIAFQSGE